jgi:hypothetical protein
LLAKNAVVDNPWVDESREVPILAKLREKADAGNDMAGADDAVS